MAALKRIDCYIDGELYDRFERVARERARRALTNAKSAKGDFLRRIVAEAVAREEAALGRPG